VLDWTTPGGLVSLVITDASHANEEEEFLVNGMVPRPTHYKLVWKMVTFDVTDLFGKLDLKRWQATSAEFIRQVWMTDCKSLEEALQNPKCAEHSDKRLSIEIASLRQDLWRKKGDETGDLYEEDCKPKDKDLADKVRWIDTDVMVEAQMTIFLWVGFVWWVVRWVARLAGFPPPSVGDGLQCVFWFTDSSACAVVCPVGPEPCLVR
ncbi:unnamed protein product, partial [Symbiodinium pilosum]